MHSYSLYPQILSWISGIDISKLSPIHRYTLGDDEIQ